MSDESVKSAAEPPKQSPENPSKQSDPQNKNEPKQESAVTSPKASPSDKTHSNDGQKKLSAWEKFERMVKIIECVALIGGVATAFFIGYQWQEMRKASGDAEKTIELNSKQLQAMQVQSDIMQAQLNEAQTARILSERAWLYETELTTGMLGTIPNGLTWAAHFKNTGQTPAINFQVMTYWAQNLKDIPDIDSQPTPTNPYHGLLAPGESIFTPDTTIPADIVQKIKTGMTYFIFGTIWYDDIFGKHHWSQFCDKIEVTTSTNVFAFMPIGKHNSCDDVETNQTN